MIIEDFFNPNDIEHIKALKVLEETNKWPENFIPKNIISHTSGVKYALINKLVDCWIKHIEDKRQEY